MASQKILEVHCDNNSFNVKLRDFNSNGIRLPKSSVQKKAYGEQTSVQDLINPKIEAYDLNGMSHLSLYSDQFFCLLATSTEQVVV